MVGRLRDLEHLAPEPTGSKGWMGPDDVLTHREICRTTSLELIRDDLAALFYPARVETIARGAGLRTSVLSATRGGHTTIGFLRFGSDVLVDPGALGAYHVNIPISGTVLSECGDRQTLATTRRGAVFTPRGHTVLPHWSEGASQLCIKLDRTAVDGELEALLGHPIVGDVTFSLGFDLTTPAAQSWLGALRMFIEELDRPGGLFETSPAYRQHAEKLLIGGLLWGQPHGFTEELTEPRPPVRPRTVKRVVDLIESDPRATHTLADLARHAGVGARRLQVTFQETVHATPMAYQRRVKLDAARQEILAGARSVVSVAHRWGFSNPGRFARYYVEAFCESPSETIRRSS